MIEYRAKHREGGCPHALSASKSRSCQSFATRASAAPGSAYYFTGLTKGLLALRLPRYFREAVLEARLQAGPLWIDRDLVFCNTTGDFLYPDNVSADFKRLVEKAGLPAMRFHDLRHSAATILLAMGVHPKVVQEILGHAQISMTMDTYSHMLPSMQREAMEGLDNLFGDAK